jgi:uncharacterized protein (DUF1330 family)
MMAVYFIANYDIEDAEAYEAYIPMVRPLLQKYGAELVAADYTTKSIEGNGGAATAILKFESEEVAMAWYKDPNYQAGLKLRLDTTSNGVALLAKGFVPPT